MSIVTRRGFLASLTTAPIAGLVGCRGTTPSIFGYQLGAAALYDKNIASVYVPVFSNRAFQTTPYRGLEVDVTQSLVREIGRTTTFKVISDPSRADTELIGNIVSIQKQLQNRNQQNTVRDGDVIVTVDVVWRDLRSGEVMTNPRRTRPPGSLPLPSDNPTVPFDPNVPPPAPCVPEQQPIVPARIVAIGRFVPELGETNASAVKRVQDQIAIQIVSMMEKKW